MKTALVLGAGGFIGNHLVNRLKDEGYWVRGVDLKYNEYQESNADDFVIGDLTDPLVVNNVFSSDLDDVYQLAADMGGAGYIFSGENDANVMHNSALINLNVAHYATKYKTKKVFYSSSACMYPEHNQLDPNNPNCEESSAYPANPDSEYGWEKLFSERLFLAYNRNYGLDVRIARFHNIFGPLGSWNNGKEKSPAAICRKVAQAKDGDAVEVWGDGSAKRDFIFVSDVATGMLSAVNAKKTSVVNIATGRQSTIRDLVKKICLAFNYDEEVIWNLDKPTGASSREMDTEKIKNLIPNWNPISLQQGILDTVSWFSENYLSTDIRK
jgi:nucleoside-diphosphate-sugar epimerase